MNHSDAGKLGGRPRSKTIADITPQIKPDFEREGLPTSFKKLREACRQINSGGAGLTLKPTA